MNNKMIWTVLAAYFVCVLAADVPRPAYVKPCRPDDSKITQCFIGSIHHLRPYLAAGLPAIQMPPVEPFRLEELSLALTGGPQGYKITLKDMDIFGISNYTVTKLKLSKKGSPFEALIKIPRLTMSADYKSSGVLLILPASGTGIFHNTMKEVTAMIRGSVMFYMKNGQEYMKVDKLTIDISCKAIDMRIEKAFQNAPILREATNLFLRENGLEVFQAMKSQLNAKLATKYASIGNKMLEHTPINLFYLTD